LWDDTAWYRRRIVSFLAVMVVLLSIMTGYMDTTNKWLPMLLDEIRVYLMDGLQPKYEYYLESISPTATAKAGDALKVMNTKALDGWVVDQFLSSGIIPCPEATPEANLCPAILFKRHLYPLGY
tara:strand:- start:884 stop:1255 length:372 start_codon:yes stop_codon:yes gene_type:complete